jgi:aspartate racemase
VQIGLIGGIGPAATDYYYRRLIALFAQAESPLEATIVHADVATLLANLGRNDAAAQVAIYKKLTARLAAAGAGLVAVTSIAGHFCIEDFKAVSPLPVIDLILEVNKAIGAKGYRRLGILGTRTAMETRFYGGVSSAAILPPEGGDLDAVHQAYVTMAAAGTVTDAQRTVFAEAGRKMLAAGAEAIMLGGTDLALAFSETGSPFPIVDCAGIHADAIAKAAMA